MKFLLTAINAKYIHSNPALYSLRAYAGKDYAEHIELAEYTINQYARDILADIYLREPDVIGFSCYIWNWNMVRWLIPELVKVLPKVEIWLGGPEVSYDADKIMKAYPQLRGIIIGEGEATFRELLAYYAESKPEESLQKIAGLYLPNGYTAERELTDMSELPFLYDDLDKFENKIIYYESSRGCPYRCSYCLSSIDKKVRLRDLDIVKQELQFFLNHKVPQVKFIDRTFNCNHRHAVEIWRYIMEHDNGITNFHFEISADSLNEEEMAILNRMRPGLVQLEIGVQSVNPQTIEAIDRKMDVDKLERIVSRIHEAHNVHQHLDLIAGLPYENYASFGNSFDRVYRMHPEQLQLGFLKVLKGSPMEVCAKQYGIQYLDEPPYEVLCTNWLTYADVLKLKRIEDVVEIFYNSGQFTETISMLEQQFASPFSMYEQMAEFFKTQEQLLRSPARIRRYHALLNFVHQCLPEQEPLYRELLTFDLYARENMKSRPEFAANLKTTVDRMGKSYDSIIVEFYKHETAVGRLLERYADYGWKQASHMTHLEPFRFARLTDKGIHWMQELQMQTVYVLFDYQKGTGIPIILDEEGRGQQYGVSVRTTH